MERSAISRKGAVARWGEAMSCPKWTRMPNRPGWYWVYTPSWTPRVMWLGEVYASSHDHHKGALFVKFTWDAPASSGFASMGKEHGWQWFGPLDIETPEPPGQKGWNPIGADVDFRVESAGPSTIDLPPPKAWQVMTIKADDRVVVNGRWTIPPGERMSFEARRLDPDDVDSPLVWSPSASP